MFPSLSQVSILNQYYHFKHDRSKRNLQKLFLPQEIDTRTRSKGKKKIPQTYNTMQDPDSHPAQQHCCCYHHGSVRRRHLHCSGLDSKRHFCSPHEVLPSALSEVYISVSLTPSPYAATRVKGNEHFPRGGRQQRQPSSLKKPPKFTARSKHTPDCEGRAGTWDDAHPNNQATYAKSVY